MKEDYPVFQAWYRFVLYIMDRAQSFPKSVRFTLTDRMINLAFDVLECIVKAIYTRNRTYILRDANLYIEKMRIYIRICSDRKYLSLTQYQYCIEQINTAGKMIGGWIKTARQPDNESENP